MKKLWMLLVAVMLSGAVQAESPQGAEPQGVNPGHTAAPPVVAGAVPQQGRLAYPQGQQSDAYAGVQEQVTKLVNAANRCLLEQGVNPNSSQLVQR